MKYRIASKPSKSIVRSDSFHNEISTAEMAQEMRQFNSIGDFFSQKKTYMVHQGLSEYLHWLLLRKKLKRADVVVKTGLDKAYVYQIFDGKKRPSRDKLITIAFGMRLTEDETQRMLNLSGHRQLWVKDERDALLLFAIQHGMSLEDVDTQLERYGLDPLAAPIK